MATVSADTRGNAHTRAEMDSGMSGYGDRKGGIGSGVGVVMTVFLLKVLDVNRFNVDGEVVLWGYISDILQKFTWWAGSRDKYIDRGEGLAEANLANHPHSERPGTQCQKMWTPLSDIQKPAHWPCRALDKSAGLR